MKLKLSLAIIATCTLGCTWLTSIRSGKSCTKIYKYSLSFAIEGLSEDVLEKIQFEIQNDKELIKTSRIGNDFLVHSDATGEFDVKATLSEKLIIDESIQVDLDSERCHAESVRLNFKCKESRGEIRCRKVV